jgi:peroxiredoxin
VFILPLLVAMSIGIAFWAHARAGKGGAFDLTTVDFVSRPVVDQRPAPGFSVSSLSGSRAVPLRQFAGKVVVLNLWASWCGPCRREAAGLEQVWRQYGGARVAFVGIDHQDRRQDGAAFARQFGLTYPLGFDPNGEVARAFGAVGIPTTYVIAPNGWIAYSFLGRVQPSDLIRILNAMQPSS